MQQNKATSNIKDLLGRHKSLSSDDKSNDDKACLEDKENNGNIFSNLSTSNEIQTDVNNGTGEHEDDNIDDERGKKFEESEEISKK